MSTTHQWFRCTSALATAVATLPSGCSAITDATSASYTQTPDDAGRFITARTTRTNSIGSTNLWSAVTTPSTSEPVSVSAPVVSGTAIYGSNLAVGRGEWQGFPVPGYNYQWYVCDNEVPQAGPTKPDGCVETSFTSGDMIAVDSGTEHTCAILADRTVQCWGLNSSGQLGNGTLAPSQIPVTVTGISNAISISAGANHTCAALADGTARCWGNNASGKLGDSTITNRSTPVQVAGLFPVNTISAGTNHTCAALKNGLVWCWGLGSSGELGNGSTSSSTIPVAVTGLNPVVSLSTGDSHTCAVEVNGTVKCWGNGSNGKLGNGLANSSSVPVTATSSASSVSAGGGHSCTVLRDGTIQCWGRGTSGQLGNNATGNISVPVQVLGISNASSVSAGGLFTCATSTAGAVLCWGSGTLGQLGTGLVNLTTPRTIGNLPTVDSVSSGTSHTCATRSSGNAVCWGSSGSGRLGSLGATGDSPQVRQVHAGNAITLTNESYLGKHLVARVVASNGVSTPIFTQSTSAITLVPTYSVSPAVSGKRLNGETLSVSAGTWQAFPAISSTTYQWFRCLVSVPTVLQTLPASCQEISGATASTYVQQRADFNNFITVRTTRANSVGTTNVWSTSMDVTNQSPNLSSEPTISGTAANGQALTVSNGSWQGFTSTPTFAYQWFVCNNAIANESSDLDASCSSTSGASATLSLTNTHVGKHLLARVTASNNVGSTIRYTRSSAAATSMPVVTSNPVISGTRVAGNPLSVSSGTWVGFPSPTSSHQWFKCASQVAVAVSITSPSQCVAIDGATSGIYLQLQQDAGSFLTVRTTLVNELGTINVWSASSEATGQPPTMISEPTLSGLASFGSLLSAIPGEWQGFPTPSISYQWFRCGNEVSLASSVLAAGCTAISGATGSTYQAIDADLGKYLMPRVTSTNFLGSPVRFTNSTSIVTSAPNPLSDPIVSGNRTTGQVLTASTPAVLAFPVATSTHQWFRCSSTVVISNTLPAGCSQIDGATSSVYTLTTTDEGKFVTAASTFTNSVGVKTVWSASAQMSYGRATFTSNSTWLVPAGVSSVDVLVVGGGGSGGSGSSCNDGSWCAGGGGGGGGAVRFMEGLAVASGQSISVHVGRSGLASSFGSETSLAGLGGSNTENVTAGRHGGSGGAGYNSSNSLVPGFPKNSSCGSLMRCGGAGGGSVTFSDISGQNLPYGGGGGGGGSVAGGSGQSSNGAGGGGGGSSQGQTPGLPGQSGVVLVRWITASD